jgi:hypothetical protein
MTKYDAAYYEANPDGDEWVAVDAEAVPVKKKLSTILSIRFSAAEAQSIRKAASLLNVTMSQFVRDAALSNSKSGFRIEPSHSYTAVTTSIYEMPQSFTRNLSPDKRVELGAA